MSDDPISVKIDPIFAELVPTFLERCKQNVVECRDALQSADLPAARRIGHALSGTAGSFGFEELAAIGRDIEQAARAGDWATVKELAERLDGHLSRLHPVYE
ncbi:MAG TPA: Hpt domain-containing protein [Burkholderiales bacterium]|nr:Hpt domain-containing protein [Burkholderiales bacterium]